MQGWYICKSPKKVRLFFKENPLYMNNEILTLEKVKDLLSDSGLDNLILWAIPVMLSLVFLEFVLSVYRDHKVYMRKEFLASASVGIGNLVTSALSKALLFGVVLFFYNLVPWRIPYTWWSYVLCLVWLDFWRYWSHRASHETRLLWATHIVHHSSEQYNFSVSFRLSWIQQVKIIFFIPVALAGFNPVIFFICHQIEVLYQFWIHTEFIKKLPKPIEFIFTTPSHHRVHHASNKKYLDKNHGSTFIIWDRMFGTFQPEEETPDYGITEPVNSYNPVYLVFHELMDIIKDVRNAHSFKEGLQLMFVRPSRLADLKARLEEKHATADHKKLV